MPITTSEIKVFKSSSGVGLGGPISGTEIVSSQMNNVFDNISSAEAAAGDTEYRCIYVKNTNASITLLQAVIWIANNTGSADTNIEIGVDPAGANTSAQIVGAEDVAPTAVSFSAAASLNDAVVLGNIPNNGGYIAVWLKRTVDSGAEATANDSATLTIQGETTA